MSRQLKFRAWGGKKMYFFSLKDLYNEGLEFNLKESDPKHLGLNTQHPYTNMPVMQFTGLLDKNGKEIYEGDIVEFWGGIGKVIFFEPYAQFMIEYKENDLFDLNQDVATVIGNIHEHPHLLTQQP